MEGTAMKYEGVASLVIEVQSMTGQDVMMMVSTLLGRY